MSSHRCVHGRSAASRAANPCPPGREECVVTEPVPTPDLGTLDQPAARAIRVALAHMPFAADTRVTSGEAAPLRMGDYGKELPVAAVVAAIDNLADVLREYAEGSRRLAAEHRDLKSDVAAMRRLLGVEG